MSFAEIRNYPDNIIVQTERGCAVFDESGREYEGISKSGRWRCQDILLEIKKQDDRCMVYVTAQVTKINRIWFEWNYELQGEYRILGDAWERAYGDLEWRGIVPERVMPWYVMVHDVEEKRTHGYGVETGANAMCFWKLDGHRIVLCMDVRNGAMGVDLQGRRLHAATIVSREGRSGETAFEAAKEFCKSMCAAPRLPKTAVYGSNNWYYAYGNSSADDIRKDAELLCELAPDSENRPFLVIDDGWQMTHGCCCTGGPWNKGNYKFSDMQKLAEDLKEKKLRPGLWVRPLRTYEYFSEECILHGKMTAEGRCLDPSHPEVLTYTENMFRGIKEWGYELIKHDFSTFDIFGRWGFEMGEEMTGPDWHFYDTSKTTAEIILQFYRAIRRGAGEEVLILGCNTISHLAAGIFEIQRTGDDTSGREWERTRKMGVNTLAFRMSQNGTFYAADADCAGIMGRIDWSLNRQWIDLLSVSGTPMFLSIDPGCVTAEQCEYIKNAFQTYLKVNREAVPENWMNTTCPDKWNTCCGTRNYRFSSLPGAGE